MSVGPTDIILVAFLKGKCQTKNLIKAQKAVILFIFCFTQNNYNKNYRIKQIYSEFNNSATQIRKAAVVILKQSLGDDYDQR